MLSTTQGGDAKVSWQATHEALEAHAKQRAGLDFEEGVLLLAARRSEVHRHFGHGSFVEYVERLLGYAPRVTHDKLRVAEALEGLPETARELREGSLRYSQARELTRVATAETETIWLKHAQNRTAREVEKMVSGHRPGSLPDSPVDPAQQRHVLRFEVSGETLATFREAVAQVQREAGEHLNDDATLLQLARHVLGGPSDEGRASYQIALDVCEDCQRARQLADGGLIDVSPAVAEMASCDAQRLPHAHVGADSQLESRAQPTDRAPRKRASQDVPPSARREVRRRDRRRCRVPGCTHARHLDLHHLHTKADGGGHDPQNLVSVCGIHHRAIHEGTLTVRRNESNEVVFSHADGTPYGGAPSAASSLVYTRAFQALRGLNFGEGEVRRTLDEAQRALGRDASLDQLLRHCLERLTARSCSRAS